MVVCFLSFFTIVLLSTHHVESGTDPGFGKRVAGEIFTRIFHIFIDAHVLKVHSFPYQLLIFVCAVIIFSYCNENAMNSLPRKKQNLISKILPTEHSFRNRTR